MKLVADRSALVAALDLLGSVSMKNTANPGMSIHAKKTAKSGTLVLCCVGLDNAIELETSRVQVEREGSVFMALDTLRSIIGQEETATIGLEVKDSAQYLDRIYITPEGARSSYTLYTMDRSYSKALPTFDAEKCASITVEGADLDLGFRSTAFCTAHEISRYSQTSVLLKIDKDGLELAATDGRRLAIFRKPGKTAATKPTSANIPKESIRCLQKLLVEPKEQRARIGVDDRSVWFSVVHPAFERAVLWSVQIEGTFPPYKEVVPKGLSKKLTVEREKLISAIKRAMIFNSQETRGIKIEIAPESCRIGIRTPESGEGEVDVEAEVVGSMAIGFNGAFLLDALRVITDNQVTVQLEAPNKPGMIEAGGLTYVVMPTNLA